MRKPASRGNSKEICDPSNVRLDYSLTDDLEAPARLPSVDSLPSQISVGSWQNGFDSVKRRPSIQDVRTMVASFDRQEGCKSNLFMFAFVGAVSVVVGFVCVLMHDIVKYAGCPTGINGCSSKISFSDFLGSAWVAYTGTERSVLYLIMMPVSGLAVSLIQNALPEHFQVQLSGSGVVPTIQGVQDGTPMRGEIVILRLLYAAIFVGAGHPMGIEGPSIHCGAAVALQLSWWCGLRSKAYCRLFSTTGAVAAISAAFNMPIAGITYVVEEYLELVSRRSLALFSIASVLATYVFRTALGDNKVMNFAFEEQAVSEIELFGLAILLGLLCGINGCLFTKGFLTIRRFRNSDWVLKICPRLIQLPLAGLVAAGLCAITYMLTGSKKSWGVGVPLVEEIVVKYDRSSNWAPLLMTFFLRQIAVMLLGAVAAPAGLLAPSLTLGALLGASLMAFFNYVLGMDESLRPAIILGMCGMFSGWFRMPATAVIVVFELTGIYSLVLPSMLCCCVASLTASGLSQDHLYHSCVVHARHNGDDVHARHNGVDDTVVNGCSHLDESSKLDVLEAAEKSQTEPPLQILVVDAKETEVPEQTQWHNDLLAGSRPQPKQNSWSCHKWVTLQW